MRFVVNPQIILKVSRVTSEVIIGSDWAIWGLINHTSLHSEQYHILQLMHVEFNYWWYKSPIFYFCIILCCFSYEKTKTYEWYSLSSRNRAFDKGYDLSQCKKNVCYVLQGLEREPTIFLYFNCQKLLLKSKKLECVLNETTVDNI